MIYPHLILILVVIKTVDGMESLFTPLIFFISLTSTNSILLPFFGQLFQQIPQKPNQVPPLSFLLMKHYLSRNVTVERTIFLGRDALKVSYTEDYQRLSDRADLVHGSAYVEVPLTTFYEGTIDVDIAAERNGKTRRPERSAAAAGVAFRIQSIDRYELVYLRMANGRLNIPQPSAKRLGHSVQYVSPTEWNSNQLRSRFPGKYEAAANIGERRWHRLRISIKNNVLTVLIDGNSDPVLQANLLGIKTRGSFAYWVDSGTNAYFSNLRIVEV